ncbi:MAG: endonuclease NucS domain-containing protein [Bdellovibrionales bacterium]
MKKFNVILPKDDGGIEVYPLKEWLRQNPQHIPSGFDATTSTSHQLRNALRRNGWSVQETSTEVRLVPSGKNLASDPTIEAVLGDENEDLSEEISDTAFGLEYQLRDFIAQNISSIDVQGKRLRLFVDPSGRDGIEYPTAVGPIDILAVDEHNQFFVFELKRARSPDHAIGQLTRYMGWVQQTIGKGSQVNGIIVAKEIGDKLRYAMTVVPNISLFEYEVEFHLKQAHDIKQS